MLDYLKELLNEFMEWALGIAAWIWVSIVEAFYAYLDWTIGLLNNLYADLTAEFPSISIIMDPVISYLGLADLWFPLSECLIIGQSMLSFIVVYTFVRYVLKLIPTVW